MNLIIGMMLGMTAQFLTFLQLQGRWKFEWAKENPWWMVLLGLPISYLFMSSVKYMVEYFDGQLWPSRIFGFTIGTITYALMSKILFEESINTKTMVCLFLSFLIILVQVFWKD